jgi:uncharacterized protein YegL
VEVLFKAKVRIVFSDAVANDELKKKVDNIKAELDDEKKVILSMSGSEINNEKSLTCVAVVLSKTEKSYNLQTYLDKIRTKVSEITKSDGVKLIDISVL